MPLASAHGRRGGVGGALGGGGADGGTEGGSTVQAPQVNGQCVVYTSFSSET
jgi:hypothetical protein